MTTRNRWCLPPYGSTALVSDSSVYRTCLGSRVRYRGTVPVGLRLVKVVEVMGVSSLVRENGSAE